VVEKRIRKPERGIQPGSPSAAHRVQKESTALSHEAGMVRLQLSKGKAHGIRPNDVVSAIAYHAQIPGSTIGKIHIHDDHTLVDVPEKFVAQVLAKASACRIHKQPINLVLATAA
jgi:ATP-dependent RNA helicase DeaD